MTLQVSKDKLRRLPYQARLNMIKHQKDFFEEVVLLIKDHQGRDHPDIENFIISKGSVMQMVDLIKFPGIDVVNMCQGIANKLEGGMLSIDAIAIRRTLPQTLHVLKGRIPTENLKKALDILTDALLIVNEKEQQKREFGYTRIGVDCLICLMTKLWKIMDYNKIADGLLPYLGQPIIEAHIKTIYTMITDKEFRARIVNAIEIHDIIT